MTSTPQGAPGAKEAEASRGKYRGLGRRSDFWGARRFAVSMNLKEEDDVAHSCRVGTTCREAGRLRGDPRSARDSWYLGQPANGHEWRAGWPSSLLYVHLEVGSAAGAGLALT